MAYHLYQTKAFILAEKNSGEANRIYYFLTPDLGLVVAKAQGVRLLKSKLRFQLDKYIYARIVLVRGKEIWRLVGAEKEDEYLAIYSDPAKLKFAVKIFSFLVRFIQGEYPQKLLFADLEKSLAYLASLKSSELDFKFLASWEQITVLRLLNFLGYIKESSKITPFISFTDWSLSILEQTNINQSFLVGIINDAIEASHI